MEDNNLFYYVSAGEFCISDIGCIESSNRTFDIRLYDLANNEAILDLINLYYIQGNYGTKFTYKSRSEWFCGYLSSFYRGLKESQVHKKALCNPTVRVLIENKSLREKIQSKLKTPKETK